MRPPGALALLALLQLLLGLCSATGCPAQLPAGCSCQRGRSAVRVVCRGPFRSADVAEVLASLGATPVDLLELRNVSGALEGPWPEARVRRLHLHAGTVSDIADGLFEPLDAELVELVLHSLSLRRFPAFGQLPRLSSLDLSGNALEEVREEGLLGLERLRSLSLADNHICSMPPAALNRSKTTLEVLDLGGNCFGAVPAQNLRSAVNLAVLDLSRNRIAAVANFELMNLPRLRELRLDSNRIATVSAMALMNVPLLETLSLRNNSLDSTKLQAFPRLTSLDLGLNHFQQMPAVHDLPQLQRLRLDGNRLEAVPTLAFGANPRLEVVDLSGNEIRAVARNAFDAVDRLTVLRLANNRLETLYRGMFDGVRNLQHLSLRNNSVSVVEAGAFDAVRHLVSLDLSGNRLRRLGAGTFAALRRLFWLDLSGNGLERIDDGAFGSSNIANLLLHENALHCDDDLRWLPEWLVAHRVRTFLPLQPDVRCAGPEALADVRLKDLMIQVANASLASAPATQAPLLHDLFGALGIYHAAALQPAQSTAQNPTLPTSSQGAQIRQMLQTAPSMVVAVPGLGSVDVSKLSPEIIAYVLQGGQIPGIPKATLDAIVTEYKQKLLHSGAVSADALRRLQPPQTHNLGTVGTPGNMPSVPQVPSPHILDTNLLGQLNGVLLPSGKGPAALPKLQIPPEALALLRLLPPGYDLSKIPVDVVNSIVKGQLPDLAALPKDLQTHLMTNIDKLFPPLRDAAPNVSLEELLSKLPSMERPVLPTFAPYDLSEIGNDLIADEDAAAVTRLRLFAAVGLGAVGVLSLGILAVFCVAVRRRRHLQNVIVDIDNLVTECKAVAAPMRPEQLGTLGPQHFPPHFAPLRPSQKSL
ncbi:hypothetical protein QR680_017304 [Steinernema hermaphroditum]|uniref:LRRCT domain-containing protein n=1 Tax=Steinernema hermaphroditum TaxID=289476 RepID=A0AA39LNE9_9BILA|nr:hypothetical protein QR680_017304 [Steinernema hermaphroditum]